MSTNGHRKIISYISAPGGVGKTTLSLCSGLFMRKDGINNLMIDLDPSLGLSLNLLKYSEYLSNYDSKKRTSADLLGYYMKHQSLNDFKLENIISRNKLDDVSLELIPSSMRMEDVMGELWHTHRGGHSEKKLLQTINCIPEERGYDVILLDNIPCYGFSYALLTLFASDKLIVPLRLTLNDLGRTKGMMEKLRETAEAYEMTRREFEQKLHFVFNMVNQHNRKKIPDYRRFLESNFPDSSFFQNSIDAQVGFQRFGTEEQKSSDIRLLSEKFTPYFEEFKDKILNINI